MVATLTALTFIALAQKKHIDVDTPAIRAMYPRIDRACERKDFRAVSSMLTSDFVEETPTHKKYNKRQFLNKIREEFGSTQKVKMRLVPLSVQVSGRAATVEVRYTMTGKVVDKTGQHSMRVEGSETHRWRKSGRHWMCGYIKEHEFSVSMDGRVVQHEP
jgi:ketosteroid isomerase-like protein